MPQVCAQNRSGTVLYSTALHYILLHSNVLYCIIEHSLKKRGKVTQLDPPTAAEAAGVGEGAAEWRARGEKQPQQSQLSGATAHMSDSCVTAWGGRVGDTAGAVGAPRCGGGLYGTPFQF